MSLKDVRDTAQLRVVLHLRSGAVGGPGSGSLLPVNGGSQLCYHVMGLVHTIWPAPIPGSVKDYIATPKMNGYQVAACYVAPQRHSSFAILEQHDQRPTCGVHVSAHVHGEGSRYQSSAARVEPIAGQKHVSPVARISSLGALCESAQSLHTTVLPLGTTEQLYPLEVHIRTDEMHRLAEYGIAVDHWAAASMAGAGSAAGGAAGSRAAAWRDGAPALAVSSNGNGSSAAAGEPRYGRNGAAAGPGGSNGREAGGRRPPLWQRLFPGIPPVLTRIGAQPANAAVLSNGSGNGANRVYDVRQNGNGSGAAADGAASSSGAPSNGSVMHPPQSGGNGASPSSLNGSAASLNGTSASATAVLNGTRPGSTSAFQVSALIASGCRAEPPTLEMSIAAHQGYSSLLNLRAQHARVNRKGGSWIIVTNCLCHPSAGQV